MKNEEVTAGAAGGMKKFCPFCRKHVAHKEIK